MLVKLFGSAVYGVDAITINIEVDTPGGEFGVFIVGLPDNAVKESKDRVISAIQNSGFDRPRGRIVVNMAPADIKKAGAAYDLPIALGFIAATGQMPAEGFHIHTTYLVSNKGHGMHVCMLPDAVDYLPAQGLLTDFVNKGLITLTDRSTHDDCDIEYKDVSFTEHGKKYVVGFNQEQNTYFIKLCQMEFGEITGIVMIPNYNAAQVEYTFKSANVTPFGETYRAIDVNYVPPTVKKTITLVKYDDGWRVKQ